ncbi:MAG: hypothetical protein U5J83_17730 [Bryobacterales bacterium]|nr:hypothetical protein [Bryobacterales bacterium]
MQLGSAPALYQHTRYNGRLQLTNAKVGTSFTYTDAAASDRMALALSYGTNANNGNVLTQVTTLPGAAFAQTYNYDQVNRLCTVREVPTSTPWGAHTCGDMQGLFGGESWRQTFGFDRFGNQWVAQHLGTNMPYSGLRPTTQSNFDANTNRLVESAGQVGYDATGNQTTHGGWTLAYDAEGRIKTSTPSSGSAATYEYDGDGDMQGLFGGESWRQTFGYDRFGNQWVAQHLGTNIPAQRIAPDRDQHANTNRLRNRRARGATPQATRPPTGRRRRRRPHKAATPSRATPPPRQRRRRREKTAPTATGATTTANRRHTTAGPTAPRNTHPPRTIPTRRTNPPPPPREENRGPATLRHRRAPPAATAGPTGPRAPPPRGAGPPPPTNPPPSSPATTTSPWATKSTPASTSRTTAQGYSPNPSTLADPHPSASPARNGMPKNTARAAWGKVLLSARAGSQAPTPPSLISKPKIRKVGTCTATSGTGR